MAFITTPPMHLVVNALHLAFSTQRICQNVIPVFERLVTLKDIDTTHQESLSGDTPLHTLLQNLEIIYCYHDSERRDADYIKLFRTIINRAPGILTIANHFKEIPYDNWIMCNIKLNLPEVTPLLLPPNFFLDAPVVPRLLTAVMREGADTAIMFLKE